MPGAEQWQSSITAAHAVIPQLSAGAITPTQEEFGMRSNVPQYWLNPVHCHPSRLVAAAFSLFLLILPGTALAAGGKPATKLVNVADTRGLDPGLGRWIADIYNTDLWLFATLVVTVMAAMGLVLGFSFDRLIGMLGIRLGRLDHHE
jgi:hypothetical protein